MCIILLHVLLGNLEQLSFGLLHQVVHVQRLVESLALDITGKSNQFTCQSFLRNDTCMVFDVRRRCHLTAELGNIERSAHFLQFSPLGKLLLHGEDVDRLLIYSQIGNSGIYQLMPMLIE